MKKVIALLLVALMAVSFVACSMGKNDTATTTNAAGTNNNSNNNLGGAGDTNSSANNNGSNNNSSNTKNTENMLESMIPDVSTNVSTEGQQ